MNSFAAFMSGWGWVGFSVVAAAFSAVFYLVNQYAKQPGDVLVVGMRILIVALMTPFVWHMEFPGEPLFYGVVLATAVLGAGADVRTMNVAAKYGAGVPARLMPASVFISFFLWLAFDPALIARYVDHPINTAGILTALAASAWFASHLKKCALSRNAFVEMIPALIGYTLTTVLNKYAMGLAPVTEAVFGYMYIQSMAAVVLVGGYALSKKSFRGSFRLTKPVLAASLLMALAWIFHMIFKNYAMAYTENPSYQGAINLLAPVFISLFYLAVKHKEEADVKSGLGIVACAMILALLTVH